jgi:tetraacyldisaccharide 4'-kinase
MALAEAPPFWWQGASAPALALWPLSVAWGAASDWRMRRPPSFHADAPVLCIGNFIAGGAGKTPAAIRFGRAVGERGMKPGFLSRGFGGRITGPVEVSGRKHNADDVGDEAVLLARHATTVVSVDRGAGARMLTALGCDFIVMDDGFQNPGLAKDFSLLVVDAKRGIGNGFVMPAGPLRAPLLRQLSLAHGVLVIGDAPGGDRLIRASARSARPLFLASIVPVDGEAWRGKKLFAYAAIADPEKFFDSLDACGAVLKGKRAFADHHPFSDEEAQELLEAAGREKARLVTTSKDMARMAGVGGIVADLAKKSRVFEIDLDFEDARMPDLVIDAAIANFEERRIRSPASR